jgi:hypothetical protein
MNYFKRGEECILQSKCLPELNGDCIITHVLSDIPRPTHLITGEIIIESGYSYDTTIKHPQGYAWDESALRKKHKPSTKSLSTMIEELNKVKV